jgi:hypothetical protein
MLQEWQQRVMAFVDDPTWQAARGIAGNALLRQAQQAGRNADSGWAMAR